MSWLMLVLLAAAAGVVPPAQQSAGSPLELLAVPKDGVAYFEMKDHARSLFAAKQWAEAEPLFRQLTASYPRDPENWLYLARTESRLGRNGEAAAAWEKAAPLIGWDASIPNGYRAATAYAAAGNKRAALDALKTMVFERHGYYRADLYDWPDFAAFRDDPEFLRIVGRPDTKGWDRVKGWTYDVTYLHDEVKRVNGDYRSVPFPAEVEKRYAELKRDIPKLSDEEVFVGMMRMLAPLHQGHMVIWGAPSDRFLPLQLYVFPDGIYVIGAPDAQKELIGSRVAAFGGVSADAALRQVREASSSDGDMEVIWGVRRLEETAFLKGIGASDSVDTVTLTLQRGSDAPHIVKITASEKPPEQRHDRLIAPAGVKAPLYLSNMEKTFWDVALPEHDAVYVQVNNILDDEKESLPDYGNRLWKTLSASTANNLIVDLRHNNGGNTFRYPELLRTIIAFSRAPEHQVYVLVGRRTYSAAANFITDIERLVDPIFVGEATSECCNFHGDPTNIRLPYSGIQGEVTALNWQLSIPGDRRRELSPEVPVQLTASAYFAGEDPALDAVFTLIAKKTHPAVRKYHPAAGT